MAYNLQHMPRLTNQGNPLTDDEKEAIRDDIGVTSELAGKAADDLTNVDSEDLNNKLSADPSGGRVALGLEDEDGNLPVNAIVLGDTSETILEAGTIGGDGNGNAVVHDGVNVGGKVLANDHLRFVGDGTLVAGDLNEFFVAHDVLAEITIPADLVVANQEFMLTGTFHALFAGNDVVPVGVLIITSNQWEESEGMTQVFTQNDYGWGNIQSGGLKTYELHLQHRFKLQSGTPLQLANVTTGVGYFASGMTTASAAVQSVNIGNSGSASPQTVDAGTAETWRIIVQFGNGTEDAPSNFFYNYNLKLEIL